MRGEMDSSRRDGTPLSVVLIDVSAFVAQERERDPEMHQERKAVAPRVEGSHRRGCEAGARALGGDERRQHSRLPHAARAAAR